MVFRLEGYCGGVMNALDLRINRVITAVPDTLLSRGGMSRYMISTQLDTVRVQVMSIHPIWKVAINSLHPQLF